MFDMFHYLIGLMIVSLLIWVLIQIHLYFSKDIQIETMIVKTY